MNTLFALYFWLMQILGVPGFGPAASPALNVGAEPTDAHAVAPPPPFEHVTATATQSSFISNGF